MRSSLIKANHAKYHRRVQTAVQNREGLSVSLWAITEGFVKEVRFQLDLEKWVGVEQTEMVGQALQGEHVQRQTSGGMKGVFLEAVRVPGGQ